MIRKTTGIIFILIANIIFLADIVFPHHHHNSGICFVREHCKDESGKQLPDNENHKHDNRDSELCCILKQYVLPPSNQLRQSVVINASHQGCKSFWGHDANSASKEYRSNLTYFSEILFNEIVAEYSGIHCTYSLLRAPPFI